MLTEQFKRSVVGVYNDKRYKSVPRKERAVIAVEISRANLADKKYLAKISLKRPPQKMIPTSKGRRASREKRSDRTHARKMVQFDKIWQRYLEFESM